MVGMLGTRETASHRPNQPYSTFFYTLTHHTTFCL